jgi:hypothetical protein
VNISASIWETLAAHFRVADFPPPPALLITTTMAFTTEAPPAGGEAPPAGGGGPLVGEAPLAGEGGPPPPAAPMFEVNREMSIPNGYRPNSFTAVVLSVGGEQPQPNVLSDETQTNVLATLTRELSPDPLWVEYLALITQWFAWRPALQPSPALSERQLLIGQIVLNTVGNVLPRRIYRSLEEFLNAARGRPPRAGVDLAIGPALVSVPFGARQVSGRFDPQRLDGRVTPAEPEEYTLPIAAAAQGTAGFAVTVTVICEESPELERRWQAQAYEAILAAHAAWDSDFRAAVAAAETRRGVDIQGRNPLENELLIRAELKRSAIAMLGGVTPAELRAVTPGNPGAGTPPSLDVAKAGRAGQIVRFYEQAFEWEHMAFVLYPYFWTGRDDWPAASLRSDRDTRLTEFLRSGYARIVLPVRPGFETVVQSRLNLDLPEPFATTPPATSADDPSLSIADEIRAAQDLAHGEPDGDPWPVTLSTTLVALDGTDLPWYATDCDPDDDDIPSRELRAQESHDG